MAKAPSHSAFSPFRYKVYRALWLANLTSHCGTWMKDVAVSWLMTTLAPTPLLVSLVQVAASLPMFLFSIPAGALADLVDRRRVVLVAQTFMLLISTMMALLTFFHWVSPWGLLTLTFLMGSAMAFGRPASESITLDLVPAHEFPKAAGLNSAGFNVARATGPALGGWLVASFGAAWAFLANSFSFLGVLLVVGRWQKKSVRTPLRSKAFFKAMHLGLRYAKGSEELKSVFIRGSTFIFFASCLWALLPLITRDLLVQGVKEYGLLLGCFGAGAVTGALFLPLSRRRFSTDQVVAVTTILYAVGLFALSYVRLFFLACGMIFFCGLSWLVVLSSFNVCVQTLVSEEFRARAVSIYMLIFFGSMCLGSAIWGFVATATSLTFCLQVAAIGLMLVFLVVSRYRLHSGPGVSPGPSVHWPVPQDIQKST